MLCSILHSHRRLKSKERHLHHRHRRHHRRLRLDVDRLEIMKMTFSLRSNSFRRDFLSSTEPIERTEKTDH